MKNPSMTLAAAAALGASLAAGGGDPRGSVHAAFQEVVREGGELVEATKRLAGAQREELVRELEPLLERAAATIAALEERAAAATEEQRPRIERAVELLRAKAGRARDLLEQLRSASGDAWKDLARGLVEAAADLGRAAREAASNFELE
jgi:hypothetical protein